MAAGFMLIIPLLAACAVIVAPANQARWIAMLATVVNFLYSLVLAWTFTGWGSSEFGLQSQWNWLGDFGITLGFGADSVAMWLVLLTTMLMPLCVMGSFSGITTRLKEYYAWLLILEAAMIGVFVARDLILFYICFEFTLIPLYFLIAVYGSDPRTRVRTATKFFIFTFTGSLLTLAGLLYVAWRHSTAAGAWSFDIQTLVEFASGVGVGGAGGLSATEQAWVLLAMLAGFGVKIPLFPVHTWLPLAHTEAPTAGSVILAAVLLKLGTYGLYRFVLPMTPIAVVEYAPAIAVLAIIGILYAALICWVQTDVKRLVAYSSVSHLGFCVLGLIALNPLGLQGSVLYMINHGLSTGALFFLVGMMYERYHTRNMNEVGGLAKRMPVWACFMVFFVLASVGLPGLNGFVSEFLCLIGAFTASPDAAVCPGVLGPWYAAIAAIGMIFAAMYLLIMTGKMVFGSLREPRQDHEHHHGTNLPADLSLREIGVLLPLAALCLWIGFYPTPWTSSMEAAIESTLAAYPQTVRAQQRMLADSAHDSIEPAALVSAKGGADD